MKIAKGIFQCINVFKLFFVLETISWSEILWKTQLEYDLGSGKAKLNYLPFINDLKLFKKCEAELDNLVQSMRILSNDIKMELEL